MNVQAFRIVPANSLHKGVDVARSLGAEFPCGRRVTVRSGYILLSPISRSPQSERFGCVASPHLFEHHPSRLQQWKSDQTNDAGHGNKQWIVHLPAEQNCK
jgi:hypothetical protein